MMTDFALVSQPAPWPMSSGSNLTATARGRSSYAYGWEGNRRHLWRPLL